MKWSVVFGAWASRLVMPMRCGVRSEGVASLSNDEALARYAAGGVLKERSPAGVVSAV